MPKILSSFSGPDPIAQTLSTLGKQLFGDQTAAAIKGEQLYGLQRANAETDNLMARIAAGGAHNLGSDPTVQAILLGSGINPTDFAAIGRMGAATEFGANDKRTADWQVGAGGAYSSTAPAFNASLAEERRAHDMASADRRYGIDTADATERFKWGTPSATDVLKNDTDRYGIDTTDARGRYGIDTNAAIDRERLVETARANDMASADRRYATDTSAATDRTKPFAALDASGNPVLVPTGEAASGEYRPVLSEAERKGTLLGQHFDGLPELNANQQEVLGARITGEKAGSLKNYIIPGQGTLITYDGVNDVHGNPLPPGGYLGTVQGTANETGVTNAVRTDLESDAIANRKFNTLVDMGVALTADPTLFGAQGKVRSLAQEIAAGVTGVTAVLNEDVEAARQEMGNVMASAGVDARSLLPELYDPNLSKVQTIWGLLVYQGAAALAGQQGRSVSDKDVQQFRAILGDPQSLFSSSQMMKAKLEAAREIVNQYDKITREALGGSAPVAPHAGGQGQPAQIRGVEDYNALPPGAPYIDPNGVPRVKGGR